jgi:NAD(P)-dependent dehydrogenase (short-subunit alcohol dehydrogenase family)
MSVERQLRRGVITGAKIAGTAAGAVAAAAVARRAWREYSAYSLNDRTVLITGGSRGLGFVLAKEFLRRGSRVAICARDQGELETARQRLAAHGEVAAYRCDLRQRAEIAATIAQVRAELGDVEVLVNNAGIMQVGPWQCMTESDFEEALQVHFWAPLWATLEVLPPMLDGRVGRIVNISSIGGIIGVPHMLPYAGSKFALTGLSEAWRAELMRYGIRVTLICPWLMRTGSQEAALFKGKHRDEFTWFAASGATPLTAISAERAARRIVDACRRGEARVVLSLPGRAAALLHGIVPGFVNDMMGLVNLALPGPGGIERQRREGAESYNRWTSRLLRPLIRAAGERFNQPSAA